jgi:hypothetical protein
MSTLVGLKDHFASPLTRTLLHATMLWGDQSNSFQILIDSGADISLIYVTLASEMGIPTQPLSISMYVTQNTTPINLRVSRNHSETIQFLQI